MPRLRYDGLVRRGYAVMVDDDDDPNPAEFTCRTDSRVYRKIRNFRLVKEELVVTKYRSMAGGRRTKFLYLVEGTREAYTSLVAALVKASFDVKAYMALPAVGTKGE